VGGPPTPLMTLMTIPPFLPAFVWVITLVCVREGRLLDVHDHGVEFCSQFFSIYTVFSIFIHNFSSMSLSHQRQSAHPVTFFFFSVSFFSHLFFTFYLRRKPPFFMRANYDALSIPLSLTHPHPRCPSLSHPVNVREAHPHKGNLRIRKNVGCVVYKMDFSDFLKSKLFGLYLIMAKTAGVLQH